MRKGLKLTSLIVAASVALGFGVVASAAEEIPAPQNSKTVNANDDGTYDVSLSVVGSVDTQVSTESVSSDVVLIADRSGSMDDTDSGDITRWESLKNAVDVLTEKVLPENTNNKVAVVTFDSNSEVQTFGDSNWTSSAEDVVNIFSTKQPQGLTYAAPAIKEASNLLANARKDTAKYVIFLSDGYPFDEDKSITASNELKAAYPDAAFYVVGIPNCDEDFLKELSGDENNYFFAQDAEELAKVFDGIATTITNSYKNVVIKDALSEYAEYANTDENGNPIFKLEVLDESGNPVTENIPELVYDAETKTVSLDLGSEQVPDKWTYTVTYTVKPSELANTTYAESGYNAVGDENTDADGNATSAGKDGFVISTGSLDFTYRDTDYTVTFANPVLQVEQKEEPSEEPSEKEPSKEEPSKEQPSTEGKAANNVPQTGSTENTAAVLAVLLVSAVAFASVKAFGSKKVK